MVPKAATKFYKTVTLAKTNQQQEVFLQLIMIHTIAYFPCLPFFTDLSIKLFLNDLQNLSFRKGGLFRPRNKSLGFQQLLRVPLPNPFRGFGFSGVSA